MKRNEFLIGSFLLYVGFFIVTCWFGYKDKEFPDQLLFSLLQLVSLPFVVTAIVQVNDSDKIDRNEKIKWTLGFITLTIITGVFYFIYDKRKVFSN
jgi:hypothetical protein